MIKQLEMGCIETMIRLSVTETDVHTEASTKYTFSTDTSFL